MGVSKKKVIKLPILPTGVCCYHHLPGSTDWSSQLFERVTDQMKYKARMAYLQLSKDRLVQQEEANYAEKKKQPFVIYRKFKWLAALSTHVGAGSFSLRIAMAFRYFKKLAKKRTDH